MSMHTIGIIGATGSVGTELCVTLRYFECIRVIAICRSQLAGALLQRCGVECRFGDIADSEQAVQLLADCDTVVDLSLPRGTAVEFRRSSAKIIENAIALAPTGARFIYASTYMAYGMKEPEDRIFHEYLFSRNVYGANKRWAERKAFDVAKRTRTPIFVLRFGQVHGVIQVCSQRLAAGIGASVNVPQAASNTVFLYTIAEAIVHIAKGLEEPGVYTLVSVPQWSWKEVIEHICRKNGVKPVVVETSSGLQADRRVVRGISQSIIRLLIKNRDFLTGYILVYFPRLERRAKALHLIRRARAEVAIMGSLATRVHKALSAAYWSEAPGRRLISISDSRNNMDSCASLVRQIFDGVTNYPGTGETVDIINTDSD